MHFIITPDTLDEPSYTSHVHAIVLRDLSIVPPWVFTKLDNLEALILEGPLITAFDPSLLNLTGVKKLIACDVSITAVPAIISNFTNVTELCFRNCTSLTDITEVYGLSGLRSLDLSSSGVTQITSAIANLTSLRFLLLSNTSIASLPSEIGTVMSLTHLDISGTLISALPAWVFNMSFIQVLNIANSGIQNVPAELASMPTLKTIICSSNQVVPDVVRWAKTVHRYGPEPDPV